VESSGTGCRVKNIAIPGYNPFFLELRVLTIKMKEGRSEIELQQHISY
jgi:hypothetical protein